MSDWAPRRFYRQVTVEPAEGGGHAVLLDGRPLRTPARAPLVASRRVAEIIAAEWDAQGEKIDPRSMPATRMVNVAIDRLPETRNDVVSAIVQYGATDLLCYRAANESGLRARQAQAWDPLLDWLAERFGARLHTGEGVVPVAQPEADLARLRAAVEAHSALGLVCLGELVGISGSLVLGLAVSDGRLDAETAFALAHIDEDWQAGLWGRDDEAEQAKALKRKDFLLAAEILSNS